MARLEQMTAPELEQIFADDNACKAYLAANRWPDEVRCPRCGNLKVYRLPDFTWQCQACNRKGYRFSVLVGTVFENTKIPLKAWFRAIHLVLTKPGVSIVEVHRTVGPGTYRTAWFVCRRIRAALGDDSFRKLIGGVEVKDGEEKTLSSFTSKAVPAEHPPGLSNTREL
jgi:predicted RNA-binding Zn-ribbon protein involved in translation (DUF1610 family)